MRDCDSLGYFFSVLSKSANITKMLLTATEGDAGSTVSLSTLSVTSPCICPSTVLQSNAAVWYL